MRRKFTIFALFYIRRGDLTEGFLRYDFAGLIFGGAYFRNFTVLAFCSLCFLAPLRRCFGTMSTYSAKAHTDVFIIRTLASPVLFGIPY